MKKKEKKNWDYLLCDVKEENMQDKDLINFHLWISD